MAAVLVFGGVVEIAVAVVLVSVVVVGIRTESVPNRGTCPNLTSKPKAMLQCRSSQATPLSVNAPEQSLVSTKSDASARFTGWLHKLPCDWNFTFTATIRLHET